MSRIFSRLATGGAEFRHGPEVVILHVGCILRMSIMADQTSNS
jgi:hypothetical protein